MFDTELFGHWWFEGPSFLGHVLDGAGRGLDAALPSDYLARHPANEVVALPEGSWGDGGGHRVWLNENTRWTWQPIHDAEARFESLARVARERDDADPLLDRLMRQTGRELLLLESSDWQFLITTFSARDYAELRLAQHASDFGRLATLAERRATGGAIGEGDAHVPRRMRAPRSSLRRPRLARVRRVDARDGRSSMTDGFRLSAHPGNLPCESTRCSRRSRS